MTNEEILQDLKQFITATVSQRTAGLATKEDIKAVEHRIGGIEVKMATKDDIAVLDEKIDLVQGAIADVVTHTDAVVKATIDDHEQRLRGLERHAA